MEYKDLDKQLEKSVDINSLTKTILVIKSKPLLTTRDDGTGIDLNDGYDFQVNGALPEIADSIAKFAIELDNQGFGKNASKGFIQLINEYFSKLTAK